MCLCMHFWAGLPYLLYATGGPGIRAIGPKVAGFHQIRGLFFSPLLQGHSDRTTATGPEPGPEPGPIVPN